MRQNLRDALRGLRRSGAVTGIALLTLALGIGANTAVFSVLHGVLLRPLAYDEPGQIAGVHTRFVREGRQIPRLTGPDLVDIRDGATSFEAFSPYGGGQLGVQLGGAADFAGVQFVGAGFFDVFRVRPVAGEFFDQATALHSAVVSAGFAERHFGSVAAALGRALSVEGVSYTVVAVAGPELAFPVGAEVWLGTPRQPQNQSRTAFNYRAVARVRSGVSLATATAELESLGATLAAAYPDSNAERSFSLVGLQEQLVGSSRATLWLLMAAAGLVLLIACANVANLLLARASGRAREIAVRSALGASRGRIVVQLLVESGLLALGGGLLGALLAQVVLSQLVASLPASLRQAGEIELAGGPLAFALGLCVVCVLLCGLAPAWHASRTDLRSGLSEAGARGQLGGSLAWLRSSLVVCEVGLAVLLATGAGLMLRTLVELGRAPLGFETEGRLVATLHVPAAGREEYVSVAREVFQVEETLGALPGVRSAAASMGLPSGPYGSNGAYAVEGRHSFEPGQELPQANFSLVGPGYFGTLGIPLRSGREIERGDLYHAPFVAVVSESLAHQTFPGEDPIGQRVQCGLDSLEPMTIVGVVGDVRQDSPASPPKPTLYMSLAQHPYFANEVQVVLRTEVEPSSLVSLVRDAVRRGRPDAALSFTTLSELVEGSTATPRLRGRLAALFAGVALLLAGAGIFGVMSYTTGRRQGEMALRRALGARGVDVWLLVVRSGLGLAATGMVLGFAGATAAAQLLKTVVFGIEPHDASTWLAVGAVTLAIAMAAIAAPAWRASRADPASLLRQE